VFLNAPSFSAPPIRPTTNARNAEANGTAIDPPKISAMSTLEPTRRFPLKTAIKELSNAKRVTARMPDVFCVIYFHIFILVGLELTVLELSVLDNLGGTSIINWDLIWQIR
jgi:hypothetical protein